MISTRVFPGICFVAAIFFFIQPAAGENYWVTLRGKVVMPDGSPPPITVAIERICSDQMGDKPGPLTNKKGEYLWLMDVDPMRSRSCFIRATHTGYTSSTVDISALNGYISRSVDIMPIVLTSLTADPGAIIIPESKMPFRAKSSVKAAMNAIDKNNYPEATRQFRAAVEAAPKFALGWHALGIMLDREDNMKEAREAFEHAIEFDSKLLSAYMNLTHICLKTKDWDCAAKNADALIKIDNKRDYPDVYLHQAVALYGLKDLDKAAASAQEAIRLDPNHIRPRAEYVYGRILEAKGDLEGAREHMSKYLELDKNVPDPEAIKQHMQNLGKPPVGAEPELEYL